MMKAMATTLLLASVAGMAQAAAPAPAPAAPAKVVYIHAGALLDKPGAAPRGPSTIVVRDGKVAEVRNGYATPEAGAAVTNLKDRFVLPGLIDLHVHLWGIGGDPLQSRLTALNRDDADTLVIAEVNARKTLEAGFTTVRDLGGDARGMRALREAVERGDVSGPTIVNAGNPISVSGGHGDGTNGLAEQFAEAVHDHQISTCDGPDDCRRAVRMQVALGAQVVKFMATGGVLSNVSGGLGRAMTPEEMRAIVETAHILGRRTAAHSHAAAGVKAALEAGVDTVDHGTFLDDEAIALFKAKDAYLVPTVLAGVTSLAQARAGALPPAVVPKAEEAATAAMTSYRKAFAAGVKFAFGTDTGVSKHGDNAQEFALLVKVGMTPAQAISTATVAASKALGRDSELGTIEPGKYADIIAVAGSPLEDVTRLERVDFVMRHGLVHKLGGKRQPFPPE
jgi:imidazolonepropionase-like amidohydrolase